MEPGELVVLKGFHIWVRSNIHHAQQTEKLLRKILIALLLQFSIFYNIWKVIKTDYVLRDTDFSQLEFVFDGIGHTMVLNFPFILNEILHCFQSLSFRGRRRLTLYPSSRGLVFGKLPSNLLLTSAASFNFGERYFLTMRTHFNKSRIRIWFVFCLFGCMFWISRTWNLPRISG